MKYWNMLLQRYSQMIIANLFVIVKNGKQTSQMSINRWLDKIIVYPYTEYYSATKKKWATDAVVTHTYLK